jgi:hypothetical protein
VLRRIVDDDNRIAVRVVTAAAMKHRPERHAERERDKRGRGDAAQLVKTSRHVRSTG